MKRVVSDKSELFKVLFDSRMHIRQYGVLEIGVFGSFVRDEANEKSDIDLMVIFALGQKTFDNFMDLNLMLEDLTGRNVQIVTREYISPFIKPYILKELEYAKISD